VVSVWLSVASFGVTTGGSCGSAFFITGTSTSVSLVMWKRPSPAPGASSATSYLRTWPRMSVTVRVTPA
jgi:hypothetical protein